MNKFKNIEFLRILMILAIVMLHAYSNKPWSLYVLYPEVDLFTNLKQCFCAANNGVEGFFIVSGFFFCLTFKPCLSFFEFIKYKYLRLAPVIIFTSLIGMIAGLFHYIKIKWFPTILSMFLLNNFVYNTKGDFLHVTWFVSALLSAFIIYFCLKKYISGKKYWIILSVLTCLGYTILTIFRNGYFTNPTVNLFGFLSVGFLRAISGIGVGVLIGEFYKRYKNEIIKFKPSKLISILLSFSEILLMGFIIWWISFKHHFIYHGVVVIAFALLLILFICQKSFLSQILNKDFAVCLGKYSYSIYVTHVAVFKLITHKLWIQHPEFVTSQPVLPVIVELSLVILIGILTYHLVEEPVAKYFSKKFKLSKNVKGVA